MLNDVLSPGIIGMPYYVATSGYLSSIFAIIFFALLTDYTLCQLYVVAQQTRQKSLPDMAKLAFGKFGYLVACLFIFAFNFGTLCAQLLIMCMLHQF